MSKYIPGGLFTPKRPKMVGYTTDTLSFSTPLSHLAHVTTTTKKKNNFIPSYILYTIYKQVGHTTAVRQCLYTVIYLFTRGGNLGPHENTVKGNTFIIITATTIRRRRHRPTKHIQCISTCDVCLLSYTCRCYITLGILIYKTFLRKTKRKHEYLFIYIYMCIISITFELNVKKKVLNTIGVGPVRIPYISSKYNAAIRFHTI